VNSLLADSHSYLKKLCGHLLNEIVRGINDFRQTETYSTRTSKPIIPQDETANDKLRRYKSLSTDYIREQYDGNKR
jgi:hypothetical protein